MKDLLDSIAQKRAEQDRLLAQLALWEEVKAQGIDIDTVASFGFDPKLLTNKQKRAAILAWQRKRKDPITGEVEGYLYQGERLPSGKHSCRVYNYVRHHDGTITLLDPLLKAV
jgi:hypothetical protein